MLFMNTPMESGQSTTATRNLQQWMREHSLISFFIMAYAFSWIIAIPYVLSLWGILKGNYLPLYIFRTAGPTMAAIIMIGISEGKTGLRLLRQRLQDRRHSWQWYLAILMGIPALMLVGIIVQRGTLTSVQGVTARILVSYAVNFVLVFFGVALPEEIGWRGFAFPRMQPRYGPLGSTLLLGVLWVFWHLLYFLTPSHGGGPGTSFTSYLTNLGYFFLMVMAIAIIMTWIFNHTRGSIFIANLVHASIDTPQLVWIPLFFSVNEAQLNLAGLIAFGAPALLILILTHGRLGYQPDPAQPMTAREIKPEHTF